MRQLFVAFALGAGLSVAIPASALTIDDFSGPLQWVNTCCSAGLEEAHPVLGGARYLSVGRDIFAALQLVVAPGPSTGALFAIGIAILARVRRRGA